MRDVKNIELNQISRKKYKLTRNRDIKCRKGKFLKEASIPMEEPKIIV